MGEIIKFPEGKGKEQESDLDRLEGLVQMIDTTPHSHNKIDALAEFEGIAEALITKGEFASDAAILQALENRGVEHASGIIELARAMRGE